MTMQLSVQYNMQHDNATFLQKKTISINYITPIQHWVPKTTKTHSEYVVFIAFLLQKWLHESAAILCYA